MGEGELVDDAWRAFVETQTAFVIRDCRSGLAHRGVGIAEEFERPRRGGVECDGFSEVAHRRRKFAALPVGLAAHEARDHRVGLQGQCAAEGLDGFERLATGDGLVAGGQQPAEFPLLPGIEPDERQGSGQGHRPDRRHDGPIHAAAMVTGSMGTGG